MAISIFPAPSSGGKIMKKTTLTSGTSWTVPAGVTDINVTLIGGGGGGGGTGSTFYNSTDGQGGQEIVSTLTTTPGASISYAIGAGGSGALPGAGPGGTGGTTTFTGATQALGGQPGTAYDGSAGRFGKVNNNGGRGGSEPNRGGGAGGAGSIIIEYWV